MIKTLAIRTIDCFLKSTKTGKIFPGNHLKRAFYERVVQVYAQEARGLDRDEVNWLDARAETYDREAGFMGLPEENATCIF